jgi:hypothetical protein
MILNRYLTTNLFLIIIICLCWINVSAQNQSILVFDPQQVSTNFQSSFNQLSSDSLYVVDTLDENINSFDALFLFIGYPYVLSEEEGNRLIEYLNLNKPIYLYTNLYWQDVEYVAFWNHIGINWYAETLAEVDVDSVVGVDTAFTNGIVIDTSFTSPGAPQIDGNVSPILDGMEYGFSGLHSTFIPEDESLNVIIDLYNLIHHSVFLERVLPHFGLEIGPPLIQFYPAVDTANVFGGCTTPEIICSNLLSTSVRDSISIEPGFNTNFAYYDSSGNLIPIDNFYFIVIDSLDLFEYDLWYHPKSYPTFNPVLIPFDSTFYVDQREFEIQLIAKNNGVLVDSFSQLFRADFGLDVEYKEMGIYDFELSQNYPNPFNPTTTIKYQIPNAGFVTLNVYDVLGNEIATLVEEEKPAGSYEVEFNATALPSGIYFYQLRAGSFVQTKKMILIK